MDSLPPTILSSDSAAPAPLPEEPQPASLRKRVIWWVALLGAIALLILVGWLIFKKYWNVRTAPAAAPAATSSPASASSSSASRLLPAANPSVSATSTAATSSLADLKVEYLSFADFYKASSTPFTPAISDYALPLNVKVDVMNYYDISRKLSLDSGLADLNNQGFTTIANPWLSGAPDFYAVYNQLSRNQIPLLITPDFLIYNYQNVLKKSYNDIEENVFYNNLWDILQSLYATARQRYEGRLAQIGSINDPVLEGERLETAYFAVALELLKPTSDQINSGGAGQSALFNSNDANRFYFVVPPYLRDDVLAEEALIRAANQTSAKSPVLLYHRDYTAFRVPTDYQNEARLNNFYLTTVWLNSVFPLNPRTAACPNCLLDPPDWRINLTAASLMAQDFSLSPDLKNKWARIYKVMSFFQGLRADWDYVNYRDALSSLFGPDYKVESLFDSGNKQASANLQKLQAKLLSLDFPEISGGLVKADPAVAPQLGFKLLAAAYWPNDYIFRRLVTPAVGPYQGTKPAADNLTVCPEKARAALRCNGLAWDAVNLVYPIGNNPYFQENSNYQNYSQAAASLRTQMDQAQVWRVSNYWTTLVLLKDFLSADKNNLPNFSRSAAWQNQSLNTAAGAWINLQLPPDQLTPAAGAVTNINAAANLDQYSYIVPNPALLDELVADDNMLIGMLSALQLDIEVPTAVQSLRNLADNFNALRQIMVKELTGQTLTADDNKTAAGFALQYQTLKSGNKRLLIPFPSTKINLREDLSQLQLMVLVHQEGENKVFSVGPVWDYQETR